MSSISSGDGLFTICHVVGKIPALGAAVCMAMAGAGGTYVYKAAVPALQAETIPVAGTCGGDQAILIDDTAATARIGECRSTMNSLQRAELRDRCAALSPPNSHVLCTNLD